MFKLLRLFTCLYLRITYSAFLYFPIGLNLRITKNYIICFQSNLILTKVFSIYICFENISNLKRNFVLDEDEWKPRYLKIMKILSQVDIRFYLHRLKLAQFYKISLSFIENCTFRLVSLIICYHLNSLKIF